VGNSHIDSNLVAKDGTETVSGFAKVTVASVNATDIKIGTKLKVPTIISTTEASAPIVRSHSYLQLGTNQYMFFGSAGKAATIVAEATALVGTPIKGSTYLSTRGEMWVYTTDAAASPLTGTSSNP
jgi:hypothetical protein